MDPPTTPKKPGDASTIKSTPIKPGGIGVRDNPPQNSKEVDSFMQNFVPFDVITTEEFIKRYLALMPESAGPLPEPLCFTSPLDEDGMYQPICQTLNKLAVIASKHSTQNRHPDLGVEECWAFVSFPYRGPKGDTGQSGGKPDLVTVKWSIGSISKDGRLKGNAPKKPRNWQHLESWGEVKKLSEGNLLQIDRYAYYGSLHQPLRGVFLTVSMNKTHYRLHWACSTSIVRSDLIPWLDLKPIAAYVYTLHLRRMEVHTTPLWVDRSSPDSALQSIVFTPFEDEDWALRTLVQPTAFGRRTHINVGMILAETCDVIVIKTQWRDMERRFVEYLLFLRAHEEGYLPGLARVDRLRTNVVRAAKGQLSASARDRLQSALRHNSTITDIPEERADFGNTPQMTHGVLSTDDADDRDTYTNTDVDINESNDDGDGEDGDHDEDSDENNRESDGAEDEQEQVEEIDDTVLAELATGDRTREFIVFRTIGKRLSSCDTILKFLMVIYDAIEAHRLLAERGILHRDISWGNILVDPKHFTDGDGVKELSHASFINSVIGRGGSEPQANLTDLDNAASVDGPGNEAETARERTGTAIFISRHIAGEIQAGYEPYKEPRKENFQLPPDVLDRYLKSRGITNAEYQAWGDRMPLSMDDVPITTKDMVDKPVHAEYHDVESFYWIIVWFFLRAWPYGADGKASTELPDYQPHLTHCVALGEHAVKMGKNRTLFEKLVRPVNWDGLLPKETKQFSQMLSDMTAYIHWPWWAVPREGMRFHGHDALQRLLLKEIWRILEGPDINPIRLYTQPLPIIKPQQPYLRRSGPTSSTLKREADDHVEQAHAQKRQKSDVSPFDGSTVGLIADAEAPPLRISQTSLVPVRRSTRIEERVVPTITEPDPIVAETFKSYANDKLWFV